MRLCLLAFVLLVGCGDGSPSTQRTNGYVVSANGDPENFTPSGFPRHRYAACGRDIELRTPFEVVPGGWGEDPLAAPLSYLDNPRTKERPTEGVDESKRLSFGFPARYRGEGLWEWQARAGGQKFVKPLNSAASILVTADANQNNGVGGETWFQGIVRGRPVAVLCTATNVPNPWCDVEVKLGNNNQRFSARFPPNAITKLERIVAIGQNLFNEAAQHCGDDPPARSTEIRIYPSRSEAEQSLLTRPRP